MLYFVQLRGQVRRLQEYNDQLEEKVRVAEANATEEIRKYEQDRNKAVRQTSTMSTRFAEFRKEKEIEVTNFNREKNQLVAAKEDLEQQLDELVSDLVLVNLSQ